VARPALRSVRPEVVLAAVLLAAGTLALWTTRLDLAAADAFRTPCCSWPLKDQPFWRFVYRDGVFAGLLLAAAALVTLTLSYWYPRRLLAWRRPALFLVLVVAVGPGLMVNVVFKDHYGRPRPREVVELGGHERFLPVWVPGSDPQAKSFPCGHCAMGFYLATPWLVLRRRRRALAWAFLAAGVGWGAVLGVARMAAGGHFLSDVLWSAGMVWLVALALHRLLDPERPPDPAVLAALESGAGRGRARLATALAGAALFLLTAGVLVATPYVSEGKAFARSGAELAATAPRWEVRLDDATVAVTAGPGLSAVYDVNAFGFPTSRVSWAFRDGRDQATLWIDHVGWFTERRTEVRLELPADGARPVRLEVGKGRVRLDLTGFAPAARLEVFLGEGEVQVLGGDALLAGGSVTVRVERGKVVRE
jgi:membrane-associated PAP2 superfamily phosphatase